MSGRSRPGPGWPRRLLSRLALPIRRFRELRVGSRATIVEVGHRHLDAPVVVPSHRGRVLFGYDEVLWRDTCVGEFNAKVGSNS
jgi:hypothetical protein